MSLSPEVLKRYTAIINGDPRGYLPERGAMPGPIPYNSLTPEHLLYDLVYTQRDTVPKKG